MGIWIVSTLWLLLITLLPTFNCPPSTVAKMETFWAETIPQRFTIGGNNCRLCPLPTPPQPQYQSPHLRAPLIRSLPNLPRIPVTIISSFLTSKWSSHQLPPSRPLSLCQAFPLVLWKTLSPLHAQFALMECRLPWGDHVELSSGPGSRKWVPFLSSTAPTSQIPSNLA